MIVVNGVYCREICQCGRRKAKDHTPEALVNTSEASWSADMDDCVETLPTAAYGEIEFPNANIAKVYTLYQL